jgi:hypothetical protein
VFVPASFPDMEAAEPALSSLIITLTHLRELQSQALAALASRTDLELGVLGGQWLPAALTSADPYGAFRELEAIPGVELVEVVFVELPVPSETSGDAPAASAA